MPEEPPVQQSDAYRPAVGRACPAGTAAGGAGAGQSAGATCPCRACAACPGSREIACPVQEHPADPVLTKPRDVARQGTNPFPYWGQIVQKLGGIDPMLYMYLRKSKAYFDGTRVLIDGSKTFGILSG